MTAARILETAGEEAVIRLPSVEGPSLPVTGKAPCPSCGRGRQAGTRTDHLRLAEQYLRCRAPTTLELKELDEFLLARAMEHDSPALLFRPVVHNTGLNSPLVSSAAAALLKQVESLAATRERRAARYFEVSNWVRLARLAGQANRAKKEKRWTKRS